MFSQGYVGVSKNAGLRFSQHQRRHENPHLERAIAKYGWDNLVKTEILISDEAYCLDIETKLRPTEKIGWNICIGGGMPPLLIGQTALIGTTPWNKGKTYGDSTKKKISDAVRLAMQNPERKEVSRQLLLGKPGMMFGKSHTTESRAKMSAAKKGLPSKHKGILATQEQKQKMSKSIRAYSWECPHCQKEGFGRGAATRWHFDNCKHKGLTNGC
jgi:hypothetical protein